MNEEQLKAIYSAYSTGQMTPEESAQYEADVQSGGIALPQGVTLGGQQTLQASPEVPTQTQVPNEVFNAYFGGQMTPEEQDQLGADAANKMISLPEGITVESYHDPMEGTKYKLAKERTLGEQVIGGLEAAGQTISGMTTGAGGHIVGLLQGIAEDLQSGRYGTDEGARMVKEKAEEMAQRFTYHPKTEAGQEYGQAVAETMAPAVALTPLAGEIGAVAQAAKPYLRAKVAGVVEPIKEEASFMRAALPEPERVKQLKLTMKENPTSKEVAPYEIKRDASGFERVVKDDIASEALKQGFEDRVISTIKSGSEKDRQNMLKMLNVHKLGKKSADFAAKNRPSDIIGNAIEERVSYLTKAKKQAGNDIESTANALKGKRVNYDPAINEFMNELDDIGVKVSTDEGGKININLIGSDIEGDIASKKLLTTIFNRLVNTDVPDAYGVHRAKRFIDTQVSYGKTKANPLSKTTENIVKDLRRNLNSSLAEFSPEYKAANTKYSDIINTLDDIQQAVGTKVDFDSPNAAKAFGTSSRKILSNYGSRTQMIDAIDKIDSTAKKYGMKVDDDIVKQVIFANEIDRMFGSPAATSFKGQIEQALEKGVDTARRGIVDSALDIAKSGLEKARGINEENAVKSMEELLKRKQEKGK